MGKYQAYPEYKDSGVEWLGVIPSHWDMVRFKYRLAEKKKTPNPQLEAGAISFGRVLYKSSENLAPETKASYQEVLAGEFLINPLNMNYDLLSLRTALSDIDVVVSTGYIVARSDKQLVKRYVRWLLYQFDVAHMKTLGSGVRQTINFMDIGNSFFYEPTRLEQEKISDFLDHETAKIDTLIDKQQQLIQLLKEKRQAVISHAVTKGLNPNAPMRDSGVEWLGEVPEHWVLARLKNVLRIRNGRDYKDVEVEEGGYPVYGSGGIFKRSSSYLYDGKSVLFGRKGTIDKPLVVSGKFWTVDTMFYSEVFDNVLPEYIYYQATFFPFNLLSTNTALPSMTQEDLLMLPFVVPPRIEQEGIIKYVQDKSARFDNLIGKAQSAIELMQERRTALISAAVTGKIDVRDWQVPALMQNKEAV